ncbi:MAG: LytTR family transcriptional regulator DNA-binding domain-containing protein [Muribaculaceae bacterium]|nr:LytTR family transcriptional regulator DNA-binding domain-containing protein [Muribaculaceae bacterium]
MYKLCLNSRDELLIIDLAKIAYFQANGNYTHLSYMRGETRLLTVGLSKVEEYIRRSWPGDVPSPFVRMGRSLIINQTYLTEISVLKQKITLSDCSGHSHSLSVPKPLLKNYKERINELYLNKISNE